MRDMSHENVNQFVGLCTDPPNICIAMVYCNRGSLQVTSVVVIMRYFIIILISTIAVSQLSNRMKLAVRINGREQNQQQKGHDYVV